MKALEPIVVSAPVVEQMEAATQEPFEQEGNYEIQQRTECMYNMLIPDLR